MWAGSKYHLGWFGFALVALAATSACSDNQDEINDEASVGRSEQALTLVASLTVPENLHPSDAVLAASQELYVNDRARVDGRETFPGTGRVGFSYNGLISHMGTGNSSRIGADTVVGTLMSRGSPAVADRAILAHVYSSQPVRYGDKNTVQIRGFLKENQAYTLDATWGTSITWPTTINPPVNLEPGGTPTQFTLAPGAYQSLNVKSGRRVILQPGNYYFESWTQEAGSEVSLAPGSERTAVYLSGQLTFRGSMVDAREEGRPGLVILSFGTGGNVVASTGNRTFKGTVLAPAGEISIWAIGNNQFWGAAHGRKVTVFESGVVRHVRDPSAFLDFRRESGVDRASVTGFTQHDLLEFEQAEAASAISRVSAGNYNVTVAYNDRSQGPLPGQFPPTGITYPAGRDGNERRVFKGVTLLGWSFSTDGGGLFHYGGRISPPPGWAAIWGDPAIAKVDIEDTHVYMDEMASNTATFESTPGYDPGTQSIVNATPQLNGHCVARSVDRGITFPTVNCVDAGAFHDGASLAIARDSTGKRQVYLASHNCINLGTGSCNGGASVWRMDGDTMTFTKLPDPFTGPITSHPRLRVSNGTLYVVALQSTGIMGNRLTTANNATTWQGVATLAPIGEVASPNLPLTDRNLRQANSYSFDLGQNANGQTRLRVIYTSIMTSGYGLRTRECAPDLTGCAAAPWTVDLASNDITPAIKHAGGRWVTTWWRSQAGSNVVSTMAGLLQESPNPTVTTKLLSTSADPCDSTTVKYWGDYNEIDAFDSTRFFAPFTVNGPTCRFRGPWTADMHVGSATFTF